MRSQVNVPDGEYVVAISWLKTQKVRRELVTVHDKEVFATFGPDITNDWQIEKIWSLVPYQH
jgi:hypothetical protein